MLSSAFLSYHSADRAVAASVKRILVDYGVECFLAHEHIAVSEEWRRRLLVELKTCDLFVCILSSAYLQSPWCIQECGIAATREDVVVIPLSIDGTSPPGFLANTQFAPIEVKSLHILNLLPAFLHNSAAQMRGIELGISVIGRSRSHLEANTACSLLMPMLPKLTREQVRRMAQEVFENVWAQNAPYCLNRLLPALLDLHKAQLGTRMSAAIRKLIRASARGGT